ncbi:MAG TPA: DUF5686 family protein [Bacteroidia bacterium]|nr:DUF5686 family protein [Bacteroidia bacterium]
MQRNTLLFFFSLFFLFSSFCRSFAQVTRVSGRVYDPLTNEAIPFASVLFPGTATGKNTDIDGNYSIETMAAVDSIRVSFIGYLTATLPVQRHKTQVINIALRANKFDLPEVLIKAGENPALILLKKVLENKPKNDRSELTAFEYESYNKLEFDINNITDKFKKKRMFKPFQFVFDNIDSSTSNKIPYLPVFLTETVSDVYFRSDPAQRKEIIKASKISGVENETVSQYLGDLYSNINIYDNYIYLFQKGFVSPISGISQLYYKYMLMDSAFIGNKWCYKITFHPRRKQELTFNGEMWVADSSFAIRKINLRIAADANINFIEDLALVHDYDFVNNEHWMLTKEVIVVNLAPTETKSKQTTGFIGRKTTFYRKFILNQPKDVSFFKGSEVDLTEGAKKQTVQFWDSARGETLTKNERAIYTMIDTIKTIPAYKRWADLVKVFATGYKAAGLVEIGPVYTFLSSNSVEGIRLRFGGQTSNKFSEWLVLDGYGAYGTKDEQWKYGGTLRYFLSKKPRVILGGEFKQDVEQLGKSPNAFADDNFFATVLRREKSNKLNAIEQEKVYLENEWVEGFSNRLTFTHSEYTPLGALDFTYYLNGAKTDSSNRIKNSEISLYMRFAYKERFVSGKVDRVSLGTRYPVIHVQYTRGIRDVIYSSFEYDKLRFKLDDNLYLGNFGILSYSIEAAKLFQALPYPLLFIHPGNNSFVYDKASFNLMNFYEFVSDEYISFKAEQHFGGIFLDRIPALRKLKWREVATFSAVTGKLSPKNRELLANPDVFYNLEKKPYAEFGIGIENIFKVLRIDNIWRLSYLDHPDISKVAILGTVSISF